MTVFPFLSSGGCTDFGLRHLSIKHLLGNLIENALQSVAGILCSRNDDLFCCYPTSQESAEMFYGSIELDSQQLKTLCAWC